MLRIAGCPELDAVTRVVSAETVNNFNFNFILVYQVYTVKH